MARVSPPYLSVSAAQAAPGRKLLQTAASQIGKNVSALASLCI
jgi:hypothetical protein